MGFTMVVSAGCFFLGKQTCILAYDGLKTKSGNLNTCKTKSSFFWSKLFVISTAKKGRGSCTVTSQLSRETSVLLRSLYLSERLCTPDKKINRKPTC